MGVKMGNLNPYYNESFVFLVEQEQLRRGNLELIVADYDRIGSSDPIGKVLLGYNRKGLEIKHWKEMIENPRRPIVHWHVLKVISICSKNVDVFQYILIYFCTFLYIQI